MQCDVYNGAFNLCQERMNCKKQSCTSEKQTPEKGDVSPKDKQCQPEAYTRYLVLHCRDVRALTQVPADRCWQRPSKPAVPRWLLVTDVMRLPIPSCQNFSTTLSMLTSQGSLVVALNTRDRLLACLLLMKKQINAKGTKGKSWYHLFFRLLVNTLKITISIACNFPNFIWSKFSCGRGISCGGGGRECGHGGDCNKNKTAQITEPFSGMIDCFGLKGTLNIT